MTRTRKLVIVGAAVLATSGLAAGVAIATTGEGGSEPAAAEQPLAGSALEQASAAALAHTGGGTVTETETGDDGAPYGVEIRLADGSQVEVSLDAHFNVIGQEVDDDGSNDRDGSDGG
jgi:uncharacterized membrane protein YkoI